MADILALVGNVLLFLLVFCLSATVNLDDMKSQINNRKAIFTGIFCQFVVLPLLGFLVVNALDLDPDMGITLLVVTSSPGGSYSNWFCSVFNTDLALSVTMTAISTVLSIAALPLNLLLYTKYSYEGDVISALDWPSLFIALAVVISAIFLGLYCSYRIKSFEFNRRANQMGNLAGLTLIIFSATMANNGDADSKMWSRSWQFYVGVSLPCILGLIIANIIGTVLKLKEPERVTVAIECVYQNVGLGSSIALSMFKGDDRNDAMGVPFFYGIVEGIVIGFYCLWAWKNNWTKAPANAPFWDIIVTSYEVLQAENKELTEIEMSYNESNRDMPDENSEDGRVLTHYFNASSTSLPPAPDGAKGQLA